MYISIIRYMFTEKSTIGSLHINGQYFCDTLEDKVRDEKIYGSTAIPQGTYKVELCKSFLVCKNDIQDWVSNSKDTFNKLFIVLQEAVKHKEEIWLTIK